MPDLFRKEAVTHATRRLAGEVVLASSVPSRVLAGLMVAVVPGGAAFAATGSYARKETVVGWLTPEAGMIRLAARQGGIVSSLHVREGDTVTVGQPIATLTLSSALEGGDRFAALSRSLDVQGSAARARAAAGLATLAAEQRQMADRRAALNREMSETRRRIGPQDERLALARAEVVRAGTIAAQGFLTRRDLEARRGAELAVQQDGLMRCECAQL